MDFLGTPAQEVTEGVTRQVASPGKGDKRRSAGFVNLFILILDSEKPWPTPPLLFF